MSDHPAPTVRSYRPGEWFGIVGEHATVVLPPGEKSRVAALWELIDDGAGFDIALDALISAGLRDLPAFVLVSSADGETKVVLRGEPRVRFTVGGESVVLDGTTARTWVERSLRDVERMSLELPGGDPSATTYPLAGGLVRISRLDVGPDEAAPAPAPDPLGATTPAPEPSPWPVQESAPQLAQDVGAPTATGAPAQGWDDLEEETYAQEPGMDILGLRMDAGPPVAAPVPPVGEVFGPDDDREVGADVPGAPDDLDHGGADASAPPEADPVDHLTGPLPPAASEPPSWTPAPPPPPPTSAPASAPFAGPPGPPPSGPPPSGPPPSGPPPTGPPPAPPDPAEPAESGESETTSMEAVDHDGLTRSGTWDRADLATPAPGIPGQPPAPEVTARPVARLVFSTGDTVDVDRVILVGRAPEARRFAAAEQPRLVTVESPHQEISSTHLEVRPGSGADHGSAVVSDLGSTNGTVLVQPGLGPEELTPGVAVQLIPGAVVDLGDGVSIHVTQP